MSPGSEALASKLCKCILPAKLKPSLLVLRGLLHRVLHHFFGSGPYISHRNETADGSAIPSPYLVFPSVCPSLPVIPPGTGAVGGCLRHRLQLNRWGYHRLAWYRGIPALAWDSHWELWCTLGWGFWWQLNHTDCQFSLGRVLRDLYWIHTTKTMLECKGTAGEPSIR